jgi:hypothetical protein
MKAIETRAFGAPDKPAFAGRRACVSGARVARRALFREPQA